MTSIDQTKFARIQNGVLQNLAVPKISVASDICLTTYPRPADHWKNPTLENSQICLRTIEKLSDLLPPSDFNWEVVGGVGVDLLCSRFTRAHADLDVRIKLEELDPIIERLSQNGECLWRKLFSARLIPHSTTAFLQKVTSPKSQMKVGNCYRIWLGVSREHLPYIDIYFSEDRGPTRQFGFKATRLSLHREYLNPRKVWIREQAVHVGPPEVSLELLKQRPNDSKAIHDLNTLDQHFGKQN